MTAHPSPAGARQPSRRLTLALLLLITLAGAALRFYQLGQVPHGLYQDEAFNGLDALNVIAGDRPLYFPANNGREPFFIYLVSVSVAALGHTPLAERLPAAVLGTLLIPAVFALGATVYHRRLGLWAAAVVAVTFWPVALSRIGLRAGALPLLAALALACAAWGLRQGACDQKAGRQRGLGGRGGLAWLALGGTLYGLTFYTYLASRFTPVLLLCFGIFWYSAKRSTFPNSRQIAVFLLAAALAVTPLALAAIQQPEILLGRVGQVSVLNPAINGGHLFGTLFSNSLAALGMFNWRGDDIARHNLPGRPVFDWALGLAFLLGVGVAARQALAQRRPAAAFPLLWVAVMLLPTLLAEDTPHFLRAVGVWPGLALLPALGLDAAWTARGRIRWLGRGAALLAVAVGLTLTTRDYFFRYAPDPNTGYLFQAAATELAEQTNVYLAGDPARTVVLDRRYWDSFVAVRFLLEPNERVTWYDEGETPAPRDAPMRLIAWPYVGLAEALNALPGDALITVTPSALHRDDLQPVAYALYAQYDAEVCPPAVCGGPALAEFANGVKLLTAETASVVGEQTRTITLMLTWQATRPLTAPVQVFAQAWGGDGLLTQADGPLGTALYPSPLWSAGAVVREQRVLVLQLSEAVSPLSVRVGLYNPETLARVPRADSASDFVEIVPRGE